MSEKEDGYKNIHKIVRLEFFSLSFCELANRSDEYAHTRNIMEESTEEERLRSEIELVVKKLQEIKNLLRETRIKMEEQKKKIQEIGKLTKNNRPFNYKEG